jgi:hypothetical protein
MKQLICFLFILSLGFAQQPEFKVSAFNLDLGETLEVSASNLSKNTAYALTLTTPGGDTLKESPRTNARGVLSYQRALDDLGEWSIRLKGSDIDTQLFVTVTEIALDATGSNESSSTNSGSNTTGSNNTVNPLAENPLAQPADANSDTSETNIETPATANQEPLAVPAPETETDSPVNETESPMTEPLVEETTGEQTFEDTPVEETPTETQTTPSSQSTETQTDNSQSEPTESTQSEPIKTEPLQTTESTPSKTPLEVDEATPSATQTPSNSEAEPTTSQNATGQLASGLEFPESSGTTTEAVSFNDAQYLGHGNSVLKVNPATGTIVQRWIVSGQVKDLKPEGNQLTITTAAGTGLTETFHLQNDKLLETVRFGNQPEVLTWLKNEANVANPAERLTQDPTNPWLYIQAAKSASGADARMNLEQAVESGSTFYDLAGISRELVASNNTDLANNAFDKALKDFSARGYDPRLLRDMNLHEAFNFPLKPLNEAIKAGQSETAGFWAKWLRYFAAPSVPQVQTALSDYANMLSREGKRSEASLWRTYARAGRQTGVASLLDTVLSNLGQVGWYGVLSILAGLVGLWLTLLFKYWAPHTLLSKRRQVAQKNTPPWSRLWVIRHYSFTEKLFVVLLLATALLLAALATWSTKGKAVSQLESFQTGTLANGLASSNLSTLPDNARANFIRGYAAQVSGNTDTAKTLYEQAGNFAPAVNNLAALNQDQALYTKALELSPGLAEARVNLGQKITQLPFVEYLSGPALAIPSPADLQTALAGTWQQSVAKMFTNPWTGLQNARPATIAPWLWTILEILFLLVALIMVIWLFIPRPRVSRNAPRNMVYHLLSLLIPGSGLADEMWGILLLIPWAVIGLDVVSDLLGWNLDIGLNLRWGLGILALIYLINLIAFVFEFTSYRKRMKLLKQDQPDLAREYGLRVPVSTNPV